MKNNPKATNKPKPVNEPRTIKVMTSGDSGCVSGIYGAVVVGTVTVVVGLVGNGENKMEYCR